MRESVVLIISDRTDTHVPLVGRHLDASGVPFLQFNNADFPLRVGVTHVRGRGADRTLLQLPGVLPLDTRDVRSVWYRRPEPYALPPDLPPEQEEFARGECRESIWGLYRSLSCPWVDWPVLVREAANKPYQLDLARRLGFAVPRTLITNDPSLVREFFENCDGRVVYKTLSRPLLSHNEPGVARPIIDAMIYTTPLEEKHLDDQDSIRCAPCLFQEYVPKRVELRITVIGRAVFAAEIHSQDNPKTVHDWRRYDLTNTVHRPHDLPDDISELCLRLVERLRLNFGAIDMILRPDGRYVFLEINPSGQYGWIEQLTGLPISEALAELLAGAGGGQGEAGSGNGGLKGHP